MRCATKRVMLDAKHHQRVGPRMSNIKDFYEHGFGGIPEPATPSSEPPAPKFCIVCRMCEVTPAFYYASSRSECLKWWWPHRSSHGIFEDEYPCSKSLGMTGFLCDWCDAATWPKPECHAFSILDVNVCGGCYRATAPPPQLYEDVFLCGPCARSIYD